MTTYGVFFSLILFLILCIYIKMNRKKRTKNRQWRFYIQRVLFARGKKGWTMLLVCPLHFVNDGGGVNVETQSCAEFKEPFCNDIQFVEGEIDFDRLGVVVLVVLIVLKEGGRKKLF